jgi:hypothetical protein
MASRHTDKLVKSFIAGSSNPMTGFDPFADLQDPTFLSFKLDFFPDLGYSTPEDMYSTGGLFRPIGTNTLDSYTFYDSAAEYLARIGSPARQNYLEIFIKMLYDIQTKAPWYFQSIAGAGDLYKIDPAINFRGKDKVLTVECLESIDLRVSLLADLYRNLAFDMQGMREVLPINLRTFNMNLHVLEFRKFNTTFGIIADSIAGLSRSTQGQAKQLQALDARRRNVYNQGSTSLFTGTFDSINSVATNINSQLGGLFTNLGQQAGQDPNLDLKSAFEAISVQTFLLKDCEFDFYSEAPGYLESLSVKDIPEASHRFKIKVGKIQKLSTYSFDKYVIAEYAKNSRISSEATAASAVSTSLKRNLKVSPPYFEETGTKGIDSNAFFTEYREGIFPTDGDPSTSSSQAYSKAREDAEFLRKKPLERVLGSVIRNVTSYANQEINQGLGNLTGGVVGTPPLGNVYGDSSFIRRATEALNDFLTPGNQLTTGQTSNLPPQEKLQKITFDALNVEKTISPKNVGFTDLPTPEFTEENIFQGENPPSVETLKKNIYVGAPSTSEDQLGKINVFSGVPPLPTDELGDRNVYE